MRWSFFIIIFLITSLLSFSKTLAESDKPAIHHNSELLQSEHHELDGSFENRVQYIEATLQKYSDDHWLALLDFKKNVGTVGSLLQTSELIIAIITVLIAIFTVIAVLVVPHYSKIMNAVKEATNTLKQTEKKTIVKQQLDMYIARIEQGYIRQKLGFKETEEIDNSTENEFSVRAAYLQALEIRTILLELQSGGKDADIQVLCNGLLNWSVSDTDGTWTKDLHDYLLLLLTGEFLENDLDKKAVKNLLRNLLTR